MHANVQEQVVPELCTKDWIPPASEGDKLAAVGRRGALLAKWYKDLTQALSVSASNSRHGPNERSVLPIYLNGKIHHALADTMASKNVISEEHAISISAVIDRSPG